MVLESTLSNNFRGTFVLLVFHGPAQLPGMIPHTAT